jgi:hypothetical protein
MSVALRSVPVARATAVQRGLVLGVTLVAACGVGCAGTQAQPPQCRGQSVPINPPARAATVAVPVTAPTSAGDVRGE